MRVLVLQGSQRLTSQFMGIYCQSNGASTQVAGNGVDDCLPRRSGRDEGPDLVRVAQTGNVHMAMQWTLSKIRCWKDL